MRRRRHPWRARLATASAAMLLIMSTSGCVSLLAAAIETPFIVARHSAELSLHSVRYSVELAKGGVEAAKGGIEVAGGAVRLIDQLNQTAHHGKMRRLEYEKAVQDARLASQ